MTAIPKRSKAPPQRRARLRSPHLCIDVREEAIYWASARARGAGLTPEAWGRIARDPSISAAEQLRSLAEHGLGRELRCEAALRAAGAVHERLRLPALSRGELRAVERRRGAAFTERLGASASSAVIRKRERGHTTLWFAGVDDAESEQVHSQWRERGLELDRVQSRHLAIGQLAACVPELGENEVVAIFDIEPETGTCVLVDRSGWIFSREVPLRFMGRRVELRVGAPSEPAPRVLEAHEPTTLELTSEPGSEPVSEPASGEPEEEEFDPLADLAAQAERLATELRRTFRYVEGQLGAAPVARVYLAGEITELIDLRPGLAEYLKLPIEVLVERDGDREGRPIGGAAVVLGMACAPDRDGGNLLPLRVRSARARQRLRRRLGRTLVVASLLFGTAGLALALQLGSLTSRALELESLWRADEAARAQLATTEEARARAATLTRALQGLDAPAPSAASLLRTLAHLVPDDASLHELRAETSGEGWALQLTVEARGDSTARAAESVSALASSLAGAPFVVVDDVERDAEALAPLEPTDDARMRFLLRGRLAPIAYTRGSAGSTAQ